MGGVSDWQAPAAWERVTAIDSHTGGEPFRVVTSGVPEIPGSTMLEKRRWAAEHLDELRRALMWEPRGHADMYGCFLTEPVSTGADLGVLFIHNDGLSTMCGHGVIAMATVAVETGMVEASDSGARLRIDTPAGPVAATVSIAAGRVEEVRFRNVPSFVAGLDESVEVPEIGRVAYDLAYGGAYYAYVLARDAGVECRPEQVGRLIERGRAIKAAVTEQRPIEHPGDADLGFLYGVIFVEPDGEAPARSRNVCVFADGEVDRSPTGTGVSGRLAIHHARGEIEAGQRIEVASLVGSRFSGRVVETTTCGPYPAVVPEIGGRAHITGRHEFVFDPADELGRGFLLR